MRLSIAKMTGVTHLYHYQRFTLDRLATTLLQHKVHCAGPRDFNDPWDCRPCYDESILDDPAIYEQHVAFFDRADRKHGPSKTDEQRAQRLQRLRSDPSFLKSLLRQMAGIDEAIHERYRVFCLSAKSNSVVMWSHYADKHRGLCLEFRTKEEMFNGAYRVEYSERYPSFNLADDNLAHNLLRLVTKSSEWAYEQEYRVIAEEHAMALSNKSLHTHDNFLAIQPTSLTSIIMGCEMDTEARDSVKEIVRQSGREVAVRRAVRIANQYSLAIADSYSDRVVP